MSPAQLTSGRDAVALLTVRHAGGDDLDALQLTLTAITTDVTAWPAIMFMADINLALIAKTTDDVAAAIRAIGKAIA